MLEWAYDGVNSSIPRNVGPECAEYLSLRYRLIETFGVSVLIFFLVSKGLKSVSLPKNVKYVNQDRTGKKVLLILMSMILGCELGFKITSRTLVYILNPCHITTAIQLYLLAAKPSPMVTALFRIQLNLMNGPVLAYVFPETESRKLFADKSMYYLQHGLMVVIPYYLMRIGGVYSIEPLSDFSWSILAYGFNLAYHWWILQLAALRVQVNLSHILCPAILDPFEGRFYRLAAVVHEGLLCPLLAKLLCIIFNYFLTIFPPTKVKSCINHTIEHKFPQEECGDEDSKSSENPKNGDLHVD
ncbi:transmembrane protein 164 [Microplitis mediator]|uniref:transmembrane protein 164 n=1 Tax=Microplitis mediator TaxID=375433 RepID=UPI002554D130|nr:transmembrane protein 164 [Microplitis mediator]XP_057324751.1 transmembrane protein 164 [Microplitis mediator]XP_057324752.1 transmembrane protein 164 [Microplitis mediator]